MRVAVDELADAQRFAELRLRASAVAHLQQQFAKVLDAGRGPGMVVAHLRAVDRDRLAVQRFRTRRFALVAEQVAQVVEAARRQLRSDEHTSELQSLMRISYAVFCLNTKKKKR